jgi:TIR domain
MVVDPQTSGFNVVPRPVHRRQSRAQRGGVDANPVGVYERVDTDIKRFFFLSRRGSVAPIAREVTDVLTEKGYKVLVQDYDIPLGASFVEAMHEAIINSRDLIILFTEDYLQGGRMSLLTAIPEFDGPGLHCYWECTGLNVLDMVFVNPAVDPEGEPRKRYNGGGADV